MLKITKSIFFLLVLTLLTAPANFSFSDAKAQPMPDTEEAERVTKIIITSLGNQRTEIAYQVLNSMRAGLALSEVQVAQIESAAIKNEADIHAADISQKTRIYKILNIIRPENTVYSQRLSAYLQAEKDQIESKWAQQNEIEKQQENIDRQAKNFVIVLSGLAGLGISYFLLKGATAAFRKFKELPRELRKSKQKESSSTIVKGPDHSGAGAFTKNEMLFQELQERLSPYFSFSGNLSRGAFIRKFLVGNLIIGMMIGITLDLFESNYTTTGIMAVIAMLIASCWLTWAACTRRMRDTGVNAWWTLTLLVPPLNIAAIAFLVLVPSNEFKGKGL